MSRSSSTTGPTLPPPASSRPTGCRRPRSCGRSRSSPSGRLRAVILNSGGANACTGPRGFGDTHRTAEHVAELLGCGAGEVAVASTGLIGEFLPMDKLLPGVDSGRQGTRAPTEAPTRPRPSARPTPSPSKPSPSAIPGSPSAAMIKGAGMLAPGLATMLCVLTTDAVADPAALDAALREATRTTLERVDTDGCMSTNDTVLLLASGASGVKAAAGRAARGRPCGARRSRRAADRRRRGRHQARRASRSRTRVSEDEAVEVGRSHLPLEPAQVRAVRRRPELGPGAGRRRHHPGGVRPADSRRLHQRRDDLP